MRCRTYQVYGGSLPEETGPLPFPEREDIAPWARQSVAAVFAMGIMEGDESGNFMPYGLYSHEQCLSMLVRLYERLPVSRRSGSAAALYSYGEYMEYMEAQDRYAEDQNSGLYEVQKIEGKLATLIESESRGSMHGQTYCTLIYKNGGIKTARDIGVCDTGYGYVNAWVRLEEPRFSEDGKTLYFTVTWKEDVGKAPPDSASVLHWHQVGAYRVEMDMETLQYRVDGPEYDGTVFSSGARAKRWRSAICTLPSFLCRDIDPGSCFTPTGSRKGATWSPGGCAGERRGPGFPRPGFGRAPSDRGRRWTGRRRGAGRRPAARPGTAPGEPGPGCGRRG